MKHFISFLWSLVMNYWKAIEGILRKVHCYCYGGLYRLSFLPGLLIVPSIDRCTIFFLLSRSHLKLLGVRWVTWIKLHTADPQIGATIQSSRQPGTWDLFPLAPFPASNMKISYLLFTFGSRDSVVGIATRYGLEVPGIESRWGEIFRTYPDRLWGPTSLLHNGYRLFPGGKGGRNVMTTHPLLVPRLRKSWAVPPLNLWIVLGLLRGSL
jgi:hypothetical protein